MKKLSLAIAVGVAMSGHTAILVVDNTPGAGAPYTTLQAAINAAASDDTIMVQPSATSYGGVSINKKLSLIGPGHYPETRNNATVGLITMNTGSSGTILTGLDLLAVSGATGQAVHDLVISRNFFLHLVWIQSTSGGASSANNWLIEGNVFVENTGCGGCELIELRSQTQNSNWVFRNNIFITRASGSTNLFEGLNATTVFYHNILIHRNTNALFYPGCSNSLFQNSIIWVTNSGYTDIDVNCTNCQWVHNLTYHSSATLDTLQGTTNLDNTSPQFVNMPSSNFDYSNDYHCAPGSPGATGASDGSMLGVHGGSFPFTMNGLPEGIPRMIEMILDNITIEQGTNSSVRVKATGGAD